MPTAFEETESLQQLLEYYGSYGTVALTLLSVEER
jgi:hypothetical protein